MSTLVKFENISKRFGKVKAVDQLSFDLKEAEIITVLGESGSGKSTLLRLLAGFEKPEEGKIQYANEILSSNNIFVPPHKRKFGMVFQDFALFPHLNVEQNIGFAIEGNAKHERVKELLRSVNLVDIAKRYPHELSGGQQQRVAMARALSIEPELLLLDEPFSSLDQSVRFMLRREVERVIRAYRKSALIVTHDSVDALDLADRILILKNGKLEQFGTPAEVLNSPSSIYVAGLFGPVNIIKSKSDSEIRYFRPWEAELKRGKDGDLHGIVEKSVFTGNNFRTFISVQDTTFVIDFNEFIAQGEAVSILPIASLIKTTRI